ncbi:DUF6152 family protein [Sphingobium cloacae]|uniref:Uncharacterized protein n=1 Tax=Sphingobium cloacae TaxID=120107 RepID=A0A1E1F1U4_9SPHN|nr:DUF6152 family protein [Sphingobium cloacae]BAV64460.1 hypothetical protein SCLO_1014200 [Sphingobium cloacae]
MRTGAPSATAKPSQRRVMRRWSTGTVLLLGPVLALGSAPVTAHHSFAMFDKHRTDRIEGTVTRFEWTNPNVRIEVAAPGPQGAKVTYKIESASINMLMRNGWRYNSMQTGDRITAMFNPFRNGRPGGLLREVMLANGTRLGG